MENDNILPNIIQKEPFTNLLTEKAHFRMSPVKNRQTTINRKSLKPFSSAIVHERKPLPTKEDLLKINSKLELIKSKCMKLPKSLSRSDSKQTLQSQFLQG